MFVGHLKRVAMRMRYWTLFARYTKIDFIDQSIRLRKIRAPQENQGLWKTIEGRR